MLKIKESTFPIIVMIFTLIIMIGSLPTHAEETPIRVLLDSTEIAFDQPPIISDGRTLVPMRAIFEAMGAEVEWEAAFQTIIGTKGDIVLKMQIGNNVITKNGESITLDVPPQLVNGRTLVPARVVAESFDAKVSWKPETQVVEIVSPIVTLKAPEVEAPPSREVAASSTAASVAEPASVWERDPKTSEALPSRTETKGREAAETVFYDAEVIFPEGPFTLDDSGIVITWASGSSYSYGTKEDPNALRVSFSISGELAEDAKPIDNLRIKWQVKNAKGDIAHQGVYDVEDGSNGWSTMYPKASFYSWNDYSKQDQFEFDLHPKSAGEKYYFEITGYEGDVIPDPVTTFVLPKLPLTIIYMDPIDYGTGWKLPGHEAVHIPPDVPVEQQTKEYRTTHRLTITDIRIEQTYNYPNIYGSQEGSVDIRIFASGFVDYVKPSGRGYNDTLLCSIEVKNDPQKNPMYPSWYNEEPREGAIRLTDTGREAGRVNWQTRRSLVGFYVENAVAGAKFTDVSFSTSPRRQLNEQPAYYIYPDDYVHPDLIIYGLLPGDTYNITFLEEEELMEIERR